MDGPRTPTPAELPRVVQFLNQNLRPHQEWSITAEYPLAFSPSNIHNIHIICDSDEVLSHAVMRPIITKTPLGLFKVAAIGSVITSTEHRNRGLSQNILQDCLRAAEEQRCDFAILWTNLYDFYRKLGFELAGSELSCRLESELPVGEGGLRFIETNKVSPEALHRLFMSHTVCSLRTVEDVAKNLSIPNSRVYTAWDQKNQLRAFAVEGKGLDLGNYIHEWGGGVSQLLPLFNYILRTRQTPLTLILPAHSKGLLRALAEHAVVPHHGYLGMIKITSLKQIIFKVHRHARALGMVDWVIEEKDGVVHFGRGNQIYQCAHNQELVRLLFGPWGELSGVDERTLESMQRLLPIPMWVWGWDSI